MSASSGARSGLFDTTDLSLATFLRCRGFAIRELRTLQDRTVFSFEDTAEMREAILDYANDGPVGVRSFCSALRDLKAITRIPDRERHAERRSR